MPRYLKSFFDFLSKPEWVAAVALITQAVILAMQWKILRRHASTLEEHTRIAGSQAKTAELIGQALQQQGKILADQTEIMSEQFSLSERIEAKAERSIVFELLLDLRSRMMLLISTLSRIQPSNYTQEDSRNVKHAFDKMLLAILPCQKALVTAIHLTQEEKKYFIGYTEDANKLKETNDPKQDFANVKALNDKYSDFNQRMLKAAQAPTTTLKTGSSL